MIASPTKLKSGDWGAKVQGTAAVGDVVTIRTKAGKSWDAKISKVIWEGNGVSIVATENLSSRRYSPSRNSGYASSCGYPCPVTGIRCTPSHPCHDCE